ncbi:MAG: hypothetical protein CMJ52_05635 [Planctomycetaceae bacterium]|nr:hypothetical protein [Planctomycetaceae bacterium]
MIRLIREKELGTRNGGAFGYGIALLADFRLVDTRGATGRFGTGGMVRRDRAHVVVLVRRASSGPCPLPPRPDRSWHPR